MSVYKFTFRLEMTDGQDLREVVADRWSSLDGWMIFYRSRPQGGEAEYWRARLDCVIAMETRINP